MKLDTEQPRGKCAYDEKKDNELNKFKNGKNEKKNIKFAPTTGQYRMKETFRTHHTGAFLLVCKYSNKNDKSASKIGFDLIRRDGITEK